MYTRLLFPILATIGLLLSAGGVSAAVIEATASSFTGDPLSVSVTIDDEADAGSLVITLSVDESESTADLRGFFAHVADESLLAGLSVSGASVGSATFAANDVINLRRGNNLNGGGSLCPCDLGLEIGSPGIGSDDIQSVTFTLSHATESLSTSFLSGQAFGVRATSVGTDGSREGSSKLVGVVPEPSTSLLLLMGLAGLAGSRRR
ncbi:MAG: PEP-CTERM sorting domain-containing protein [bacterium]|nr:PEP-CTERM sorting domain-containing protein [bacterium]